MQAHRLGIFLLLGSVLLISCSDTVAKLMTAQVAVMQIALLQSLVMLISVPVLARNWRLIAIVKTRHPVLHTIRSLCQLGSALSFFTGLRYLPLADIVAIVFIGPLMITVLAALILKEKVGPRRWLACVVGFLGALIVVRPGFGELGWAALYPIAATTLYSVYVICTRLTAPHEHQATLMFYAGIASVTILGLTCPLYWITPDAAGWLGLITIAVVSASSAALAIKAYALAPASLLAPYAYVEIVSATLFGYFVFNDLPDVFTATGAAIIVASGLYIFHREPG